MNCPGCGVEEGALHRPGCLQKVVDDYMLMERKARAWDELTAKLTAEAFGGDRDAEFMLARMGLAPPCTSCKSCHAPTKNGRDYCDTACEAEHQRALTVAADQLRALRR